MMYLSYWEREAFFNKVDICVIGSGIVGLSAALEAKRKFPEKSVLILERGFLPYGASTRNAGFACFGSITELDEDLTKMSENEVFALVGRRWKGLQNLQSILGQENMGFEPNGGYEVFSEQDVYEKCLDRIGYYNSRMKDIIGENVYSDARGQVDTFGFKNVKGLIKNNFEAQIDTGKALDYFLQLVRTEGVKLLNGVEVKSIEGNEISLVNGPVFTADKIILATNGFAKKLLPELEVTPARAQVLITKPIKNLKIKGTFHYENGFYYFRNVGDRVLFGGGRNLDIKGETTPEMDLTTQIQERLEQMLNEIILPGTPYEIDMRWSGIMGVGDIKVPIVKKLSEHLLCAVRMGGMGVAIGSLVGKEVVDLLDQ